MKLSCRCEELTGDAQNMTQRRSSTGPRPGSTSWTFLLAILNRRQAASDVLATPSSDPAFDHQKQTYHQKSPHASNLHYSLPPAEPSHHQAHLHLFSENHGFRRGLYFLLRKGKPRSFWRQTFDTVNKESMHEIGGYRGAKGVGADRRILHLRCG